MARKSKKDQDLPQEEPIVNEVPEEPGVDNLRDDEIEVSVEEEYPAEESSAEATEEVSNEQYDELREKLLAEYSSQKESPGEGEAVTEEYSAEKPEEYSDNYDLEHDESLTAQAQDDLAINSINSESPQENVEEFQQDLDRANKNTAPDVDQGLSKVAISKKNSLAMMVIVALILSFIIYKVLYSSVKPTTVAPSEIDKSAPITKPIEDTGAIVVPEIPKLPTAPVLAAPTPPPAPVPPVIADINIPAPQGPETIRPVAAPAVIAKPDDQAEAARKKARLTSGIMTLGGGASSSTANVNTEGQSLSILARNNDQVVATSIGDLRRVIAQGKMIDAILETAINTDLPGTVRAIVSRDIYSESGKNTLIPRGSRLVGTYSSAVTFGVNRVKISWNRLIRPDGVDIKINSPGTDQLGRAGSAGDIDNHVMRSLTAVAMTSIIDIALAGYADKKAPITGQTTAAAPTTIVTTIPPAPGSPPGTPSTIQTSTSAAAPATTGNTPSRKSVAYSDSITKIGEVGKDYASKIQAMAPTITIDQGTALKVFVNKDLVFPGKSANLTMVID